jgi:hypothetical protein
MLLTPSLPGGRLQANKQEEQHDTEIIETRGGRDAVHNGTAGASHAGRTLRLSGRRVSASPRQIQLRRLRELRSALSSAFPDQRRRNRQLSADRSATLDTLSNVEGISTYHATLGGKPTEAPDGSAALKVLGRHSLRAVRDYPNNQLIVDLVVVGKKCTVKIKNVLKPGKHQYTFHTMVGLAYCEAPTITKVSCAPL